MITNELVRDNYNVIKKRGELCEEWANDFSKFEEWMISEGYRPNNGTGQYFFPQRYDKSKKFSPENCFLRGYIREAGTHWKNQRKRITPQLREEIINIYKNTDVTIRQIAEEYRFSFRTIQLILSENGTTKIKKEIKNLDGEIWKKVDINPKYEISNYGRVKSLFYHGSPIAKLIGSHENDKGYITVAIPGEGRSYQYVHRLVAKAFVPNPNNYNIVNHIDENKLNNQASNLEWRTHEENTAHSLAKPIIGTNIVTGEEIEYASMHEAEKNGTPDGRKLTATLICKCINGKRSSHAGYLWRYKKEKEELTKNISGLSGNVSISNKGKIYFKSKMNDKLLSMAQEGNECRLCLEGYDVVLHIDELMDKYFPFERGKQIMASKEENE